MKLVAVTRLWNEDDIVEAFVRHHAPQVDRFLLRDTGRTDRTLDILRALAAEGFPLTVLQTRSVSFDEASLNTWLYHHAASLGADWVLYLDADEFVDPSAARRGGAWLRDTLAVMPAEASAVRLRLGRYIDSDEDDAADLLVPRRMRWRSREPSDTPKVFVRGGLGSGVTIEPGNHAANRDGARLPDVPVPLLLAHYPRRSGWHDLSKSGIGWLKTLAAGQGQEAALRNGHYRAPFETVRDRPATLLANPAYRHLPVDRATMVDVPLAYAGGSLRHTVAEDPAMRALTLALRYAEALARQHGRLIDALPAARELVADWNGARETLFVTPP